MRLACCGELTAKPLVSPGSKTEEYRKQEKLWGDMYTHHAIYKRACVYSCGDRDEYVPRTHRHAESRLCRWMTDRDVGQEHAIDLGFREQATDKTTYASRSELLYSPADRL
jgi:hypothetical protein